jgi:hypothetical protein
MAYLVSTVIAKVQRRLPDANGTDLLDKVNQIHRHILAEIPELRRDSLTINVTSGTYEYALGETEFQVDSALWITQTGQPNNELLPTNVESLNRSVPQWRTAATATPTQFYISSAQVSGSNSAVLGLYPSPNVSTSGGYPYVQLWGSVLQSSDLTTSDSCLVTLQSSQVYVEGVSFLAAAEIRPQLAGTYKQEFEYQLQLAKKYVRTRNEMLKSVPNKNIRGGGYQQEVKANG